MTRVVICRNEDCLHRVLFDKPYISEDEDECPYCGEQLDVLEEVSEQ